MEKLTDREVAAALARVPDWRVENAALHREFVFVDFAEAFTFMTCVAALSEARDHHPDWSNVYNRVTIDLRTHDADGITERDFELATAIDAVLAPG